MMSAMWMALQTSVVEVSTNVLLAVISMPLHRTAQVAKKILKLQGAAKSSDLRCMWYGQP